MNFRPRPTIAVIALTSSKTFATLYMWPAICRLLTSFLYLLIRSSGRTLSCSKMLSSVQIHSGTSSSTSVCELLHRLIGLGIDDQEPPFLPANDEPTLNRKVLSMSHRLVFRSDRLLDRFEFLCVFKRRIPGEEPQRIGELKRLLDRRKGHPIRHDGLGCRHVADRVSLDHLERPCRFAPHEHPMNKQPWSLGEPGIDLSRTLPLGSFRYDD